MARASREPRLTVRDARPDDFPAIERIFVEAGRAAWAHILPPEGLAALAAPARWHESRDVFVAELDGEVVGFVALRGSEVDAFYTDPAVWGRGAGRALMAETLRRLRDTGFAEATLWTAEENRRPRRFYEAAGWRPDGTVAHRDKYGAQYVELRYRIVL